MLFNFVQLENALPPIIVTPSGISIYSKFLHPEKTASSIISKLLGNLTDDNFEQP